MYRASHQEKTMLYGEVKIPGEADKCTTGRLSAYRQVNLTELSLVSPSLVSQVASVIRIGANTKGSSGLVASGSMRNTS